jgi:hypothetical protein
MFFQSVYETVKEISEIIPVCSTDFLFYATNWLTLWGSGTDSNKFTPQSRFLTDKPIIAYLQMAVFWAVAPCILVQVCRRFRVIAASIIWAITGR